MPPFAFKIRLNGQQDDLRFVMQSDHKKAIKGVDIVHNITTYRF